MTIRVMLLPAARDFLDAMDVGESLEVAAAIKQHFETSSHLPATYVYQVLKGRSYFATQLPSEHWVVYRTLDAHEDPASPGEGSIAVFGILPPGALGVRP